MAIAELCFISLYIGPIVARPAGFEPGIIDTLEAIEFLAEKDEGGIMTLLCLGLMNARVCLFLPSTEAIGP